MTQTPALDAANTETAPAAQDHAIRVPLAGRILAAIVAAIAIAVMCWSGLNHDVRYCIGGMRNAGLGGIPASGTFIHRPLAYRWLLSGLDHLTTGPVATREAWIRLIVLVFTAAVIWTLRRGLARFLPQREATAVSAAIGLSLLFAPAWDFLQPEWIAVWLAVAALAAGTALRQLRYAVPAAGVLAALVVLVKYTTAPTALLPLGVLIVLDRRRGWWTAAAACVATPLGFALAIAVQPREWRWFNELSALNPGTPLQSGFSSADLTKLIDTVAAEALMNPVVALLPAAVALLARSATTRRARRAWPLLTALGVAGVLCALIVQGQWFLYHLAALPVLGAALWGLAVARHPTRWMVATTAALGLAVPVVIARPVAWRLDHQTAAYVLVAVVVLTALAAATRLRPGRPLWYSAAVAAVLALGIPAWPTTPYSYDTEHSSFTALDRVQARHDLGLWMNGVRDKIGPHTPVVYLSFGDMGYQLGSPTHCRYPTPDFLQRTRYNRDITSQASYRENLACIADPTARFALVDNNWFPLRQVSPQVAAAVRTRFDCARPVATYRKLHLVVCPLR